MSKAKDYLENLRRARRDLDSAVSIPLRDMDDWRLNVCQDSLEALQAQLKALETEFLFCFPEYISKRQNFDLLVEDSAKLEQIRTLLS